MEHLHLIEGPLRRQAGSDRISASSDETPLTNYPAEHGIFYLEPVLLNIFSGELPPCMSHSNEMPV